MNEENTFTEDSAAISKHLFYVINDRIYCIC